MTHIRNLAFPIKWSNIKKNNYRYPFMEFSVKDHMVVKSLGTFAKRAHGTSWTYWVNNLHDVDVIYLMFIFHSMPNQLSYLFYSQIIINCFFQLLGFPFFFFYFLF